MAKGDLQGVPDGAQLWKIGDQYQLIYTVDVPGKKVPIRLAWRVYDEKELNRIYGSKKKANNAVKRTISQRQYKAMGIFNAGTSEALADLGNHPWVQFKEEYNKERKLRPWLGNKEMLHIALEAYAEGRTPTTTEIQNTKWYQSRNDAQRQWAEIANTKPEQAEQMYEDNRVKVGRWISEAGISNLNKRARTYIVNKFTHGDWSEEEVQSQILNLADYHNPGTIDDPLRRRAGGQKIRTNDKENEVRDLARQYLGPALGNWDNQQVRRWASILRTDPNGGEKLENMLTKQFRAQWGDIYGDDELTYEDIAAPWRNFGREILGEQVNEKDDVFQQILKTNDAVFAREKFYDYGLRKGIRKVENDVFASMEQGFGSNVLSMEEAR